MKRVYGIEPKIEHFGCMVDLLGGGWKLLEAEELIKGMVWKPDVVIWGALLGASKNHGNIEVAERVVNEILVLEPHNHGVYVVLSNMYAEAGQWGDVLRLRKLMKEGSLKKTPGWSLVDSENVYDSSIADKLLFYMLLTLWITKNPFVHHVGMKNHLHSQQK
ncbi:hypothetical protein CMV_011858 [Castanea mollissima]|uniref:Pentatricopeptide repeat-containing protein n=1 Tax=Castanea mollissima TaxID=60419 RepID=A0A8J4RFW9_9ROSI|nr:hypothetical protein CMV_011858 [Castanea mollissima]